MADGFAETIAHVDMDAFFVEVERLRRPELRGRAVLVGGAGPRGVVASASYEARARGARSAMPMAHARRLCPHAVVVPPDHEEYRRLSASVFEVFASFSPAVEPLSVDEAFLDISGLRLHHPTPGDVAASLRAAVRTKTGLPASVGVATSKFVAKLASDAAKPDGTLVVAAGGETAFLHPMGVRSLWGVGEATHARLEELGVRTIGDLAALPEGTLVRRLGPALGAHLAALAMAEDPRSVESPEAARSISVEVTYDVDLEDAAAIDRELLRHADRLAGRLRAAGVAARTVTLKVRWSDFTTITRSETVESPVDSAHELHALGGRLFERAGGATRPVRLLGLGGSGLVDGSAPRQLDLAGGGRWDDVQSAVEQVRDRFGSSAVGPARLASEPRRDREGPAGR
ncbi:MAG: DNA polymerase IV [Acidimicrobiia bacterium]|nr:DNA polymerase IV [Acidimicrobiia bacterium]